MPTAKDLLVDLFRSQAEDGTPEEIVRELAFHLMVERGLADANAGRKISNDEMESRIRSWSR